MLAIFRIIYATFVGSGNVLGTHKYNTTFATLNVFAERAAWLTYLKTGEEKKKKEKKRNDNASKILLFYRREGFFPVSFVLSDVYVFRWKFSPAATSYFSGSRVIHPPFGILVFLLLFSILSYASGFYLLSVDTISTRNARLYCSDKKRKNTNHFLFR